MGADCGVDVYLVGRFDDESSQEKVMIGLIETFIHGFILGCVLTAWVHFMLHR